ncbi:MAG: hypothetical protein ACXQS3_05170 [Candidatus Methanofastidiosia archaeon]
MIAICMAVAAASLVISFVSYSYLSDEGSYLKILEDDDWSTSFSQAISYDISVMVSNTFSLSKEGTDDVYTVLLDTINDDWIEEEGTKFMSGLLKYITGKTGDLDLSIDITIFKQPLANILSLYVPAFLIDAFFLFLPSSIQLSAFSDGAAFQHMIGAMHFLNYLRYVSALALLLSFVLCYFMHYNKKQVLCIFSWATIGMCIVGILEAAYIYMDIQASFNKPHLLLLERFGSAFSYNYVLVVLPYLLIFSLFSLVFFVMARHRGYCHQMP